MLQPMKNYCAGVYLSESGASNKRPRVNEFLEKFVYELKQLFTEGIYIGTRKVNITNNAFVCDAPAHSDLKCIVNHNA